VGLNAVSSWVKHVIKKAYDDCDEESMKVLRINVHEVRAVATSTAFYGNVALHKMLKSVRWAQQTTFTSFYMRDMVTDMEGVHRLGPVTVALNTL
jgi:hypothetical protein